MNLSIIFAILWVMCSTVVAFLPMRLQFPPGIVLLASAPLLILWLGYDYGWFVALLAFAAFASMFRNAFRYFWNKWGGSKAAE